MSLGVSPGFFLAAVCSDCGWPPFFVKKSVVRAGNEMWNFCEHLKEVQRLFVWNREWMVLELVKEGVQHEWKQMLHSERSAKNPWNQQADGLWASEKERIQLGSDRREISHFQKKLWSLAGWQRLCDILTFFEEIKYSGCVDEMGYSNEGHRGGGDKL